MGQILHGSATTTAAARRAIQHSQASPRELAARYGINQKTVAKWRRRTSAADARMGPKEPRSTVLTKEEEALIVAFRKHTLLPLDDCLYALQATVPHLTRSSLHRCFQRHGIARLPETEGDKPARKTFKAYPIGFFHIDIAEVRTEEGKLYLFVAIDRTSKFAIFGIMGKHVLQRCRDTAHRHRRGGMAPPNVINPWIMSGKCSEHSRNAAFVQPARIGGRLVTQRIEPSIENDSRRQADTSCANRGESANAAAWDGR